MMDKNEILDELLKEVGGGTLLDDPDRRLNHIIKVYKKAHMTKEEFISDLPKILMNFHLSDGNNLEIDVKKITDYVNWRWDYI